MVVVNFTGDVLDATAGRGCGNDGSKYVTQICNYKDLNLGRRNCIYLDILLTFPHRTGTINQSPEVVEAKKLAAVNMGV